MGANARRGKRDAFRRNLFIRHDGQGESEVVAVDWTYVGIGALGEDLVSLVHGSLAFSEVAIAEARNLDALCMEGYLEGLNDVGWRGDPRQVRLGYAAGSAMIFGIGYTGMEPPSEEIIPWLEEVSGRHIDELRIQTTERRHFLLELADEALALMATLWPAVSVRVIEIS